MVKSALNEGLSRLQTASNMESAIWGAFRSLRSLHPEMSTKDISTVVIANFGIKGMTPAAIYSIYNQIENHFLGKGHAEDDTEKATQSTDQ